MIEVAKQYSVAELIKEMEIPQYNLDYMRMYAKSAVDVICIELLCRGYEFLYADTIGKCFIILSALHNPEFKIIDEYGYEKDIAKFLSNLWCGIGVAGAPMYLRGKTENGKWIIDDYYYDTVIYEFRRGRKVPPHEIISYMDEERFSDFADNFEESQATEFKKWYGMKVSRGVTIRGVEI